MEAARTRAPLAVDGVSAPSRYLLKLASDEALVARVRRGSDPAFGVLFERHHRGMLSFCRHLLGSREEAEDAVQQAFTNAYRSMLQSDASIQFKPWVYRIARNHCISQLRSRRQMDELSDSEPSLVGIADQAAQRSELRDLLSDLVRLPVDQREALVLTELHDNSHAEAAAIIGCDKQKVKSLVFQARSSLIKSRKARELPCDEIRAQLSVLSGAALRRTSIRRHLQHCEGCRSFQREVKRQRQALSVILPVIPSATLKFGAANAIAAAGVTGAGAAAGTSGGSGALATLAGKLGLSSLGFKAATATVAVTVAAGGGAVAVKEISKPAHDRSPAASSRQHPDASREATGLSQEPNGTRGSGGAALSGGLVGDHHGDGKGRGRRGRREARSRQRADRERELMRTPGRRNTRKAPHDPGRDPGARERTRAKRRAAEQRRAERRLRRERAEPPRRRKTRRPARRGPVEPIATTPTHQRPLEPTGPTFPTR